MPTKSIIIRQYPHETVQVKSEQEQKKLSRYDVGMWHVKYFENIPKEYNLDIQWQEKK